VAGELNRALAGQLRGAQARLEAGETSKLELTLHQLELNTAAQALLTAEEDAQTALGALENALQSPAAWIVSVESSPRMSQKFPP
jgi:outer membrane protein TolC